MSNVIIREDIPNSDSLMTIIEEMSKDKWVGPIWGQTTENFIERMRDMVEDRYEKGITSTVAFEGSSIVGIAFNKKLGELQSECANIDSANDYWKMGNFFILPHHRGKGLGKKALAFYLENKSNKVYYFAERDNVISNKVALSVGMIYTHDFAYTRQGKVILMNTETRIRQRDVCYYHVYTGVLPPSNIILNKHFSPYRG